MAIISGTVKEDGDVKYGNRGTEDESSDRSREATRVEFVVVASEGMMFAW